VFVDPDNGLEPVGQKHRSAKVGKSVLLTELRELATPGRCLIVYHHQTRRKGGHFAEMERCADRLRQNGFATVDALRASPRSPRVFFLLDAPADIRHRAKQIESRWQRLITCHPDRVMAGRGSASPVSGATTVSTRPGILVPSLSELKKQRKPRRTKGSTTEVGYINRNHQEVIRATGTRSTNHEQLVYVLRYRRCRHRYGANGCDIFQRRCRSHFKRQSHTRDLNLRQMWIEGEARQARQYQAVRCRGMLRVDRATNVQATARAVEGPTVIGGKACTATPACRSANATMWSWCVNRMTCVV
jgi:hypothetical protein